MMLHTTSQDSLPCGFRQEDFFCVFPYIRLCKTHMIPGAGALLAPGASSERTR